MAAPGIKSEMPLPLKGLKIGVKLLVQLHGHSRGHNDTTSDHRVLAGLLNLTYHWACINTCPDSRTSLMYSKSSDLTYSLCSINGQSSYYTYILLIPSQQTILFNIHSSNSTSISFNV